MRFKPWDPVKVNLRKKSGLESDRTGDSLAISDQGEE